MQPVKPDRGYAWLILVASAACNYLSGVLVYFVGVIHVELLNKYHGDVTTTAWAGSIYSSLQMLGAPLASLLVDRYSCRVSVVVGGMLLCLGFTLSAFTSSVLQLIFTYGLIAGTGLGLTYSPSLMVVTFYFEKFRGLASGISVSGCAVGILTGSLLTQKFIDMYSLSGAFLIIAGLGLQSSVFGMLYRPTQHEGQGKQRVTTPTVKERVTFKSCSVAGSEALLQENSRDPFEKTLFVSNEDLKPFSSVEYKINEKGVKIAENRHTPDKSGHKVKENGSEIKKFGHELEKIGYKIEFNGDASVIELIEPAAKSKERNAKRTRTDSKSVKVEVEEEVEKTGLLKPENEQNTKPTGKDNQPDSFLSKVKNNFTGVAFLLKNHAFLAHSLSVLFAGINMSGVYLHLPEYARTHGTNPTEAAALFVGVGLLSLASRLSSGFLLTSSRVNAFVLSVGLMGMCGLSSCLFPLYSSTYIGQMTFASLFGLSTGGFFTLINVLTVELVPFQFLPAAYGVLIFNMGIGYVAGPPLAGFIVDSGGTYEHSFIFLGLAMFGSAGFDMLAKIIHSRKKKELSSPHD